MDIIEETDENPTNTHNNRFLHHFLDSYNAKMGAFGNYVKTVTENINKTLTDLELALRIQIDETEETGRQYDEFSTKLTNAEMIFQNSFDTTNKTLSKLMDQFNYFKDNQEQYLQTYSNCLSQEHKENEQHINH